MKNTGPSKKKKQELKYMRTSYEVSTTRISIYLKENITKQRAKKAMI